jgi:hypothetical protein
MSILGPVTAAERRGWQRRNALALVELLKAAHEGDLPPLAWSVTTVTGLVGRCTEMGAQAQREAFEAWATFLAPVERWPERRNSDRTHLHATRERYGTGQGVQVVIMADLYDEPEVDEQGPPQDAGQP